ncbi:tetratricopeptide repeat protein [Massilia sp. PWRC2]|uniref:O-linked N-acetylglucosamine transferase, SPINDLY family protein n=1 Tax=Massilia sp. PWRC2 TaxID=2804626 RepID=UPI003CE8E25A
MNSAPDTAVIDGLLAKFAQGNMAEAGLLAQQLTEQYPDWGFGYKALGIALQSQSQVGAAVEAMAHSVRLLPDDAEVHNNYGLTLTGLRRAAEAEQVLRRALALAPDYAEAHNNLAIALLDQGKLAAAELSLQRALQRKPDYIKAHNNLAMVLQAQGRLGEAVSAYRRTLALHPLYADAHSNMLFCLSQMEEIDTASLQAEHGAYAERFEAPLRPHWPQHTNRRDSERVLRIGIVSGDLRDHPVAAFCEPVLAVLAQRPGLQLHAYSNHPVEDAVTARLKHHFAHWTTIAGSADAVVAARIEQDGIDILIDLAGHTAHNRLPVFARKPAPLQASWIGYPGSTGLAAMDYYLTDPFMLPPGQFDHQFSEKLLHLPVSAPFLPSPLSPAVNRLPASDNGYLTFGSFNRPSKLSAAVVALWSRVLRALPAARMLLASMPADGSNDALAAQFALNGIARQRLDFYPRADMASYLALHQRVDICLDTFPYSGGTTTLHALYMGVPTVTLLGSTAAGCQGASIMRHSGLPQLIADDADDFVAIAVAQANDLAALATIRAQLRGCFTTPSSSTMDGIALGLELALRAIWQRWCAQQAPAPLQITLPQPS